MTWSLFSLIFLFSFPALAQDDGGTMTFGEDEANEVEEESSSSDDGGTMTFGEEDAAEAESEASGKPTVGVVAVPNDIMDAGQRSDLQSELAGALQQVREIQLQTGPAVLDALKTRTVATCVTEPLCLGNVGEDAGVDQIVMARVKKEGGTFTLDVDYFDVADRLFMKYSSSDGLSSFKSVVKEVEPTIADIFDIRQDTGGPNFADENAGQANTILGISLAVLSAGALTGGIIFGNQAATAEEELNAFQQNENGVYQDETFTQQKARTMLDDAESKAATANIFYGLSGAFAVASGVLFITGGNSGEQAEPKNAKLLKRLKLKPVFAPDGAGFSAGVNF